MFIRSYIMFKYTLKLQKDKQKKTTSIQKINRGNLQSTLLF